MDTPHSARHLDKVNADCQPILIKTSPSYNSPLQSYKQAHLPASTKQHRWCTVHACAHTHRGSILTTSLQLPIGCSSLATSTCALFMWQTASNTMARQTVSFNDSLLFSSYLLPTKPIELLTVALMLPEKANKLGACCPSADRAPKTATVVR